MSKEKKSIDMKYLFFFQKKKNVDMKSVDNFNL